VVVGLATGFETFVADKPAAGLQLYDEPPEATKEML